jgi:steroid delta-isomerase-like uncharacterized protein
MAMKGRETMSVADLKARTQEIFDMFNTHDARAAAAIFAADAELHDTGVAQAVVGPDAIAAVYSKHFAAIPDARVHVDRMVAEGDTVAVEWTLSGTQRGRMMGIPATGKPVSFKGISFIRYRGTMVIADTRVWDLAGLLRQIGLLPRHD